DFTVEGDDIRYGLAAIKNVGKSFVELLCREREENGDFTGFYDFCKRMANKDFNKRAIESLIKVGAFDAFPAKRRQLYNSFEAVQKSIIQDVKSNLEGQLDLFSFSSSVEESSYKIKNDYNFPECSEFEPYEILNFEKNLAGIYLSGHPMDNYKEYSKNISTCNISQLTNEGNEVYDNTVQTIVATITKCRNHTTKKNDIMCFATVEDLSGSMDVILFPKVLDSTNALMQENNVIIAKGRVSLKDDSATLVAENVWDINSDDAKHMLMQKTQKGTGLYVRFKNKQSASVSKVMHILGQYNGHLPVYFYFEEEKQKMMAPEKMWIYENSDMFNKIELIVGKGNIAYKK
ncbi:MAG: hypothetical protein J6C76_04610, partial [Oscillospiraceae bacterium]|nr:hypothetical protein [Oscillospiraceae bacterium]